MFGLGATELIIILVLALVIFGPGKLPEVGRSVGRSIREFKRASSAVLEDEQSVDTSAKSEPKAAGETE